MAALLCGCVYEHHVFIRAHEQRVQSNYIYFKSIHYDLELFLMILLPSAFSYDQVENGRYELWSIDGQMRPSDQEFM